jgi:hypothetical protein
MAPTATSLLPHRTLPEEVITTPSAGKALQEAVPRRRSENRPFRLGRPTRDPHERAWLPKTVPRSSWRGRFEVPRLASGRMRRGQR